MLRIFPRQILRVLGLFDFSWPLFIYGSNPDCSLSAIKWIPFKGMCAISKEPMDWWTTFNKSTNVRLLIFFRGFKIEFNFFQPAEIPEVCTCTYNLYVEKIKQASIT